ncbi:sensor domain-containing diguanylate cyclase [Vibrio rhodolitus]|uniref:sensor domain-containing diguanylate cyclase n=1 Tax=Vibrio rhodolitus TaxID=2231649 RepID=UPI001FC95739|nr:sensor domain-containing diguanylate cyclase [Vibrio rhodolitus]
MVKLTKVILIITSLFIVTELLTSKLTGINHEQHSNQAISKLNKEIKSIFNDALITSEVIKEMVLLSNERSISLEHFNKASKKLLETYINVDALLYLPNGIVELAYPYQEHKLAIGHNVLSDEKRKRGANESITYKETTIVGPIKLVQNGRQAFVLRKSVSDEKGFIGLSSSVIYLDSILRVIENQLKQHDVKNYSISGYNPDTANPAERVIISGGDLTSTPHKGEIQVFETKWDIAIYPDSSNLIPRLLVLCTLVVTILILAAPVRYFRKYQDSEKQRNHLQKEAHTDFLTGLLNRRGFEFKFDKVKDNQQAGAIAVFDIDFFKNINDNYGHDVGDMVLIQFSKICDALIHDEFILSRTGGEEFMLLMPDISKSQAKIICESLREAVAKAPIFVKRQNINITVSIGISNFTSTDKLETAVAFADKALYLAKRTGRNRVCIN